MVEPATAIRSVNVKSMNGEVRSLTVPATALVHDLKVKLTEVFAVPVERQRLIFQGKLLKDDVKLDSFLKEDGMTVHMMIRAVDAQEQPREAPSQAQQPPGFFGLPLGDVMTDPQGFFRQVTQMVTQMVPENMQGIQVNFGAEGPFFQVLQRAGAPAQSSQPSQPPGPPAEPAQPSAHIHSPPSVPVDQRQMPEERKREDFVLPYGHIHNLSQIVNSLMGPQASFPALPVPALPFPKNPLAQLGGFLQMYQFQVLRLLPFISRLADLLQRESLLTDPQHRTEVEALARSIGAAMHELGTATQGVAGLLPQVDMQPRRERNTATMTIRELLEATDVDLREVGTVINGVMECFTLNDLGVLFEGRLQPLERFQSTLRGYFHQFPQPRDTLDQEQRRFLSLELASIVRRYLVPPSSLPSDMDYVTVTTEAIRSLGERVIDLVLDYSGPDFTVVLRNEVVRCVGSWAHTVSTHLNLPTLDSLITAQFNRLFGSSVHQSLRSLHNILTPLVQSLIQTSLLSVTDDLQASWSSTIQSDLQKQSPVHHGLSRCYKSMDPFAQEKREYESPQALLNEILTYAMQDAGVNLPPAALPEDLAVAFVELVETDIRKRTEEDEDFEAARFRYMQGTRKDA